MIGSAAKWGFREHRWENRTNFLLFIGSGIAIFLLFYPYVVGYYILSVWMVLTFLVHLYARFSHWMEKRLYGKRFRG